jgi:hypothetical protein
LQGFFLCDSQTAPADGLQVRDAAPVDGRHWLRQICYIRKRATLAAPHAP